MINVTEATDEIIEKIEEYLDSKYSIELSAQESDDIRDILDAVLDRKMESE